MQASPKSKASRRAREKALDDARWRAVLRSAQDAIISIDESGRITLFNPAAERMFGYEACEIQGHNVSILMPEPYRAEHDSYIRNYQATRVPRAIGRVRYVEGMRRNGERFPIELSVSEANVDGAILYTAIIRDVTEIVRTQAAMRAREEQQAAVAELGQRALTQQAGQPLLDYAVVMVCRTLAVEYAKVLQYFPDQAQLQIIAGYGWSDCVLGRVVDVQRAASHAAAVVMAQHPIVIDDFSGQSEFERSALFDEHKVTSGAAVAIPGRGRPFGVLAAYAAGRRRFSGDDITFLQSVAHVIGAAIARDSAERELLEARRLAQQRERLADIGAITAKIVHDLGNPLAAISMQAQLLLRRARRGEFTPIEPVLGPVEHCLATVRRLESLTREFNDFARDQRIERRNVAIGPLLDSVTSLWQPVAEAKKIHVSVILEPTLPPLFADEDKLRRVLDNLVKNAIDAIDPGPGSICITAEPIDSDGLRISVADSGCGVPDGVDVFRLFETTKRDGTGIGLAVAAQIALAHGGRIQHHPNQPRGTVFSLELPLSGTPASSVQPLAP